MSNHYSESNKLSSNGTAMEKEYPISAPNPASHAAHFYEWLKQVNLAVSIDGNKITMREINELRRKMQKHENMIKILQSVDCTVFSQLRTSCRRWNRFSLI